MGQSKTGGYNQVPSYTGGQNSLLDQVLQFSRGGLSGQGLGANPIYQQAINATQGYLPGGAAYNPIVNQANRNFTEQTIPGIMNAFGTDNKGSSALNQALAHAGENLNSNIASQMAQTGLQASNQLGNLAMQPYNLGLTGSQQGLNAQPFSLQKPLWADLTTESLKAIASAIPLFL